MEIEKETERPVNIINRADVEKFLACNPSPEDLEEPDKHGLDNWLLIMNLTSHWGATESLCLIINALGEKLCGTLNPDSGGDQRGI